MNSRFIHEKLTQELTKKSRNSHNLNRYINFILHCIKLGNDRSDYYEKHHILPSSLFPEYSKFTDAPWNIIKLTAREHYLCHWMLAKCIGGKMWYAFSAMSMQTKHHKRNNHRKNSTFYESSKKHLSIEVKKSMKLYWTSDRRKQKSEEMTKNNHFKGKKHTEEFKSWLSKKRSGKNAFFYGKKRPDHSKLMKVLMKGKIVSFSHRKNISKTHNVVYTCPHCGVSGGRMVLRWHYNNCFIVNENVPLYKAISPDKNEILFGRASVLCEKYNLSVRVVSRLIKIKDENEYCIGKKATIISNMARNTVGWKFLQIR